MSVVGWRDRPFVGVTSFFSKYGQADYTDVAGIAVALIGVRSRNSGEFKGGDSVLAGAEAFDSEGFSRSDDVAAFAEGSCFSIHHIKPINAEYDFQSRVAEVFDHQGVVVALASDNVAALVVVVIFESAPLAFYPPLDETVGSFLHAFSGVFPVIVGHGIDTGLVIVVNGGSTDGAGTDAGKMSRINV